MKKLILIALAAMTVVGMKAQNTTTVTRFAGEKITGVEAAGSWDVTLEKSSQTGAVVKIDKDLEQYLKLELKSNGAVSISLKDAPSRVWRGDRDRVMHLTLSLPEVQTIRLSGSADLTSRDVFVSENVDIWTAGSADIEGLDVSGSKNVKLQTAGSSDVELRANSAENLTLMVAGSGDVEVEARGVKFSKLSVAGSADVDLRGSCERGEFNVAGSADVETAGFVVNDLKLNVAGSANVWVNAAKTLTVSAVGSANVRYKGDPQVKSSKLGSASVSAF